MYSQALEYGIGPAEFWEMSVPEIMEVMDAKNKDEEYQYKKQIALIFGSAEAVTSRIGYLFTDEKKRRKAQIVQPWDIFPELMEEERRENEQRESAAAIEEEKANMEAIMQRWNAARREAE